MSESETLDTIKRYFRRKGVCTVAEALGFVKQEDGSFVYNGSLGTEADPMFVLSEAAKFVTGDKDNLDNQSGINTGDETTTSIQTKRPLKTVKGESLEGSGNIEISKSSIGLSDVNNTSDLDKPVSNATQAALNNKLNISDLLRESLYGTLLEADVSGAYAIDFSFFADARLNMTGDTVFTINDILSNSQAMLRSIKLTGQFVPTLPGTQVNGETYDGSLWNRISFDVNKLSNGSVEILYTIEVI